VYSIYCPFVSDTPSTCEIAINSVHSHCFYYHSGLPLSSTFFTFLESSLLSYTHTIHLNTLLLSSISPPHFLSTRPLHATSTIFSAGADVCHLNLHKTFCIPHGGGGPGVGTSSFPLFTLYGVTLSKHCYGV
jgi:hypothetical protein